MQSRRLMFMLSLVVLIALASIASAQDPVSGKYEGVAKSDQIGEIPLTAEIKNENGKISGKIDSPQGQLTITSGTFAEGKLTMKFDAGGTEGTVTATLQGDKIIGKWEIAGQGGPLELKRVGAASTASRRGPGSYDRRRRRPHIGRLGRLGRRPGHDDTLRAQAQAERRDRHRHVRVRPGQDRYKQGHVQGQQAELRARDRAGRDHLYRDDQRRQDRRRVRFRGPDAGQVGSQEEVMRIDD